MPITAPLSSKLALISAQGFAFRESRQPDYRFEWHTHDCAMLLWPRLGRLKSAWMAPGHDSDRAPGLADSRAARLVRGSAVLLPVCAAHLTVSDSGRQQHGELYLPPDSLHECRHFGALRLDGATIAMLDALLAPTLTTASAALLVRAIVAQVLSSRPLALPPAPVSIGSRMVQCFMLALEYEAALPAVEAVACELGVSTRQLQRAAQEEFGASPVSIRRRLLAAHARALLGEGHSLARVSERLGFATSGHLSRLLRTAGEQTR